MIKPTLNPPLDSRSNDTPVVLMRVKDGIPTEDLLVNLTETLASAHTLACNFAFELNSSRREGALGVVQLIEVAQLPAEWVLEGVGPSSDTEIGY